MSAIVTGDGVVAVNELVGMVTIALERALLTLCLAGDANGDAHCDIDRDPNANVHWSDRHADTDGADGDAPRTNRHRHANCHRSVRRAVCDPHADRYQSIRWRDANSDSASPDSDQHSSVDCDQHARTNGNIIHPVQAELGWTSFCPTAGTIVADFGNDVRSLLTYKPTGVDFDIGFNNTIDVSADDCLDARFRACP